MCPLITTLPPNRFSCQLIYSTRCPSARPLGCFPLYSRRRIGYWGDIDTWGLKFLANVQLRQSHVEAVMMVQETLLSHVQQGVCEKRPTELPGQGSTPAERTLFEVLRTNRYGVSRLEQERRFRDYVEQRLEPGTQFIALPARQLQG
ncbi:DUF2220 family protein [Dickeya dadantii]|uniref:Wadjet anti-phage system protein JetD domain-containing protein n=1 Tax=Dickeya dadantii TaxID=204038 RepID=UPI0035A85EAB